jgi:hypothetical protein
LEYDAEYLPPDKTSLEARNPKIYLDKLVSITLNDEVVVPPEKVITRRLGVVKEEVNENTIVTPDTTPTQAVFRSVMRVAMET